MQDQELARGRAIMERVMQAMAFIDDNGVRWIKLYRHNSVHLEWHASPVVLADQFWASSFATPDFTFTVVQDWLRDDTGHGSTVEYRADLDRLMTEISDRRPLRVPIEFTTADHDQAQAIIRDRLADELGPPLTEHVDGPEDVLGEQPEGEADDGSQ